MTPTHLVALPVQAPLRSIVHNVASVELDTVAESFDAFYERDYRSLVGLAYVMTGSHWLAEELAQEAMTEAHRRWSKVGRYDDPQAWVRRVMINKKISSGRRLRSEAKAMLRLRSRRVETTAEIPEDASEVWEAVCQLPRRQAEAIALFYWEDRPIAEIADILGLGVETVKTHLKRGRAALATSLHSDGEQQR